MRPITLLNGAPVRRGAVRKGILGKGRARFRDDSKAVGQAVLDNSSSIRQAKPIAPGQSRAYDNYVPCFQLVLARCDPNVVGRFNRMRLHVVAGMSCFGHRIGMTPEEQCAFARALLDAGASMEPRHEADK